MELIKRYGYYFLLIGIASDLLTPYILGIFYPKMNQMKMVISEFGDVASPVRNAFLVWSVVSGIFFVLAMPAIYTTFAGTSKVWATALTSAVGLYGIADCIFTGLFSIDSEQSTWTFSTWVHNIGSGVGYAGFLLFPLFLAILYQLQGNSSKSQLYLLLLVVSLAVAGIYGLARIPAVNQWPLMNQLGFWQRLSFLFNYLPMALFAIDQLKQR